MERRVDRRKADMILPPRGVDNEVQCNDESLLHNTSKEATSDY